MGKVGEKVATDWEGQEEMVGVAGMGKTDPLENQ
jgi:hypothetical protein